MNGGIYQRYRPTVIGLTRIDRPRGKLTAGDWFYAQLPDADGKHYVDTIEGMSGGPIIGFARGDDGRLRYWLLAVQSSWYQSTGEIRACPIAIFAEWLRDGMTNISHD